MKMKIEIRNDTVVVSGYVNAVGRDSRPITDVRGKFVEQIEPGAFRASLERSENVDLLLNHDKSMVYASTKDGSLKLTEDSIGLRAEAVLSDAEMIRKARSGEFRGWSFGMYVGDSAMEERAEGIPRRHVKSLNMFEVSLIDKSRIPCYVGTSVECRSDGEILAELRYSEEEPEIIEEERSEPEVVDYSAVDDVISELRYGAVDNVIAELRYNPYHDPSNGRFTSGGGGGGGVLVVEKGQKGKGVYVVPSEKFDKRKIGNAEQQHSIERIEKKLSERPDTSKMPEYKLDEVGNVVFSYETKKIVSKGHGKMNYAEDVYERTYRRDGIIFTDGTVRFRDVGGTNISEKLVSKGKPEKTKSASSSKASNVETYVINKGTPSQYFGLKTPDGEVIHAPNNWKTEKGALNWAKKNGYASRAFDPIDSVIEELRYNPYHDPSNGRFCSGGGGGGGGVLVVEKGQKGKGYYVVDADHDEEYEKWKAEKDGGVSAADKAIREATGGVIQKDEYTVVDAVATKKNSKANTTYDKTVLSADVDSSGNVVLKYAKGEYSGKYGDEVQNVQFKLKAGFVDDTPVNMDLSKATSISGSNTYALRDVAKNAGMTWNSSVSAYIGKNHPLNMNTKFSPSELSSKSDGEIDAIYKSLYYKNAVAKSGFKGLSLADITAKANNLTKKTREEKIAVINRINSKT